MFTPRSTSFTRLGSTLLAAAALATPLTARAVTPVPPPISKYPTVNIAGEAQFEPLVIAVHAGDLVRWVNTDHLDHTVTSDDRFDYAVHQGLDKVIPGRDSNRGQPGYLEVEFPSPGLFVYYDKGFARLDRAGQPVAPGPLGGIQDAAGDYGTPMMGIVWVLPKNPA